MDLLQKIKEVNTAAEAYALYRQLSPVEKELVGTSLMVIYHLLMAKAGMEAGKKQAKSLAGILKNDQLTKLRELVQAFNQKVAEITDDPEWIIAID